MPRSPSTAGQRSSSLVPRPHEAAALPARAATAPPRVTRHDLLLGLGFAAIIGSNAALLFVVEPLFSKLVLPLLGGAPAVWNGCLLVYQGLLLAGYGYAWAVSRWLAARAQLLLHAALIGLSLLWLPIGIPDGWSTAPGAPVPWLIALLLAGLGLPFLVLATGAPLLQHWFARTGHRDAANPYLLYSASNAGSLLALIAYPFVVEPLVGLARQRVAWSMAYVVVAGCVLACGAMAMRTGRQASDPGESVAQTAELAWSEAFPAPVGWRERLWWTLLAFAPSSLLLGVTSYLTTDLAVVPLFWVVPLALYLLTFVIVFARRPPVSHARALRLHPLVLLPLSVALFTGRGTDVRLMAPLHLGLFFLTALVCHGELARRRPPPARLTEYYLWLAVGGVLGGAFNVLLAPVLFDRVLEYQIVLALACALRPWQAISRRGWGPLLRDVALPLALFGALVQLLRIAGSGGLVAGYAVPLLGGAAALACLWFSPRPLRFGLGVLALFMAAAVDRGGRPAPLLRARSFFGVYAVRDEGNGYHALYHGSTLHGAQRLVPASSRRPLTYYRTLGPLGDIVGALRLRGRPLRIGVVGLGAGTVACHARAGDRVTFYEIDPLMVRIARDPRLFSYLADCAPSARLVLGDARLSLAADTAARYDLLVLDAFSSDAIPVHLLTREALRVYLSRLAPDGVLAVHISNRYLDLRGPVAALAADAGASAMAGTDLHLSPAERRRLEAASRWVAVAGRASVLEPLRIRGERWQPLGAAQATRLWTDDYSNVLGALSGW